MISYEKDPDVVRWNLHLIDVCALGNDGTRSVITQYDTDSSQTGYIREGYCQADEANFENDAVIASALQEELSRVAAAEASGFCNDGQASILAQDWHGSSQTYHFPGHDSDLDATDYSSKNEETFDFNNSNAAGSNSEKNDEDDNFISGEKPLIDITDEYPDLDGEVGKRLNQMVPVPHIPKINGEIPSADEQISDHQRLLDRLQVYDLVELKVQGDGNCQFRSLSDQLYRSPEYHKFVRERVVIQLKSYPEMYKGYVPMVYEDYLKNMSKNGEWGDHVTLQAAADSYGVKIFVITSYKDTCYIEILPHVQMSERVLCLSFWAEVHYNSIYPEGGNHIPVMGYGNRKHILTMEKICLRRRVRKRRNGGFSEVRMTTNNSAPIIHISISDQSEKAFRIVWTPSTAWFLFHSRE